VISTVPYALPRWRKDQTCRSFFDSLPYCAIPNGFVVNSTLLPSHIAIIPVRWATPALVRGESTGFAPNQGGGDRATGYQRWCLDPILDIFAFTHLIGAQQYRRRISIESTSSRRSRPWRYLRWVSPPSSGCQSGGNAMANVETVAPTCRNKCAQIWRASPYPLMTISHPAR